MTTPTGDYFYCFVLSKLLYTFHGALEFMALQAHTSDHCLLLPMLSTRAFSFWIQTHLTISIMTIKQHEWHNIKCDIK